ncbi:MAG: hypothetical protein JWO70_3609 [Betaproteobacteria bacterium]|nr:hypothetical protein [Betaproteobacteria bacterium]
MGGKRTEGNHRISALGFAFTSTAVRAIGKHILKAEMDPGARVACMVLSDAAASVRCEMPSAVSRER